MRLEERREDSILEEPDRRETRTFRTDLFELRPASEWVRTFTFEAGLGRAESLDLELAANELLANVMLYAHDDRGAHEIRMSLEAWPHIVRMTLEDDGRPFDPFRAPFPDRPVSLDQLREGGRGIHIVRSLFSEVSYERRGLWNRVAVVARKRT